MEAAREDVQGVAQETATVDARTGQEEGMAAHGRSEQRCRDMWCKAVAIDNLARVLCTLIHAGADQCSGVGEADLQFNGMLGDNAQYTATLYGLGEVALDLCRRTRELMNIG